MSSVIFEGDSWKDYKYWQQQDRRTLKKINNLIDDIIRNGNNGIGHPKPLTADLSGKWSRHIDEKNRLIYQILPNNEIEIHQCKGHYSDK
ncbi:MAG: Txe/YoeB family addiction module toxin [Firmicutes bacterium]|nr:Txe/YoeB family addiction module toxin [Bacillota bacterium]